MGSLIVTEEQSQEIEPIPQPRPGPVRPERGSETRGPSRLPQKSGLSLLTLDELPLWDALVEESPQCSVFLKSWWLKAACGRAHILGYFEPGRLIAGIPLHYEQRFGARLCMMPMLTQTLGVVIKTLPGKKVAKETRETDILTAFAERLASETVFVQAFHPTQQNWLPFYWRGYTQTTHYTYVLDDLSSIDRIWDGLERDRHNNIRKARRLGIRVGECSPETVYRAAKSSFARQNRQCPFSLAYFLKLYEAARARNAGVCMAASDAQGRIHAAEFFVWDQQRGYRIAGGYDAALGSSGGSVLLAWSLIEFASTRTAVFDFEGSMLKTIEASYRSFGAARVPYNRIVKMPSWLRIALCATGRSQI